jgi:hypothetical protein
MASAPAQDGGTGSGTPGPCITAAFDPDHPRLAGEAACTSVIASASSAPPCHTAPDRPAPARGTIGPAATSRQATSRQQPIPPYPPAGASAAASLLTAAGVGRSARPAPRAAIAIDAASRTSTGDPSPAGAAGPFLPPASAGRWAAEPPVLHPRSADQWNCRRHRTAIDHATNPLNLATGRPPAPSGQPTHRPSAKRRIL